MKNKLVKMMALLTATTMVAAGVMGCGSDSSDASADANTDTTASDTTANADTTDGADLSGTVTLAGSTSMEKLANAMNEAFMEKYPNVSATAEFTGPVQESSLLQPAALISEMLPVPFLTMRKARVS